MKILMIARLFYPHIGGVERHVGEISKRLIKKGHEVVVVTEELKTQNSKLKTTTPFQRSLAKRANSKLIIYRIPVGKSEWFKKFQIWWWFWKNRRLIENADIVHAHDVAFWYFPFRFLYPKKPFFVTFHGWEGVFPPRKKAILIRKIAERLSWGNICVGDYIKKWYGTKPSYITYGGATLDQRVDRPNQEGVVFIGRLDKDTGLPIYLQALKKAKTQFLGDGSLRKEAEKYGKVLGFVENVRPYILKSRFVFTSGYLSILEAMAAKRLVLAVFDNPLKKDYLKMAPFAKWIIIESEPKKLTEKIKYFLAHPEEEEKLVEKAYNWAKSQSWDKLVELYLKLWREK